MAESSSSSTLIEPPIILTDTAFASGSSSALPADLDDAIEDVCSICLESFSNCDPPIVTTCKHEYHLQCILEWSQRSKECPICWQSLVLMDPDSQNLLNAIQIERRSRPRQFAGARSVLPPDINDYETEYEHLYTSGSEFSDRILQRVAAAMGRARYVGRSQMQSPLEPGPSDSPVFPSHAMFNGMQMHISPPEECHSPNASSGYTSPSSCVSPISTSPMSPAIHSPSGTDFGRDGHNTIRQFSSQSLPNESQRSRPPEMFAFSDSIKSRWSAASARYKHSFSKGTQGFKENLKEKFLVNNNSVKELSKGVQREMNAGIAGLAKMIDRLEIKPKRGSQIFNEVQRPFDIFSKGKLVQEDGARDPTNADCQMESAEGSRLDKPCHSSLAKDGK